MKLGSSYFDLSARFQCLYPLNKVWIQYDGSPDPVAEALMEAGIPQEDIVLGFHPENLRQYTGFAVS